MYLEEARAAEPAVLTVTDFLTIAGRRKWSFFLTACAVAVLAAIVALAWPPTFRSSATILIEEQEIPSDFVTATVTSYAEQRLQQINQRIMSSTRLLEIIDRFELYKKMRERRTTEEVIEQMRKDVRMRPISAEVVDRRTGRPTTATIAFSLSYQGKDSPATIQRVANVLVSLFLKENLQVRERQTEETSRFLQDEMQRVRAELSDVEKNLSDFKEQHLNELPEMVHMNLQELSRLEAGVDRLEEQLRSFKEREGYLQTQLSNLSPFQENTDRKQLEALETELATLRARFSEEHPDVVRVGAAAAAIKQKIADDAASKDIDPEEPDNPAYITLSSQLASVRSEIDSIANQMREFARKRREYEKRIEASPNVERNYKILVAEQANLKAKHDDLMQKHMEAQVAHGLEKGQKGERFTLIDPPRLPEKPFKPNRTAILIIGLVLGMGAGIALAAVREFMDQSVRKPDQLTAATGFPVLGAIPAIITAADRRRLRIKRAVTLAATCAAVAIGTIAFHYWVMDLYVLWARVSRKLML